MCVCASSERYVKHVMEVHHHDLEWHAQKLGYYLNVKVTVRAYKIEIWLFLLYHLNYDSFATKHSMIVNHYKPKCPGKILDCCVQLQVQG